MSVVGFAYHVLDNNLASKIEMKNTIVHVLGTSKYINSKPQFMDKVMDKKSLELFGFHRGGAKKHAK